MTENEMHFGGYGFLIVLILFIWMIFGGGFGNFMGGCRGGYGYGGNGCGCTTNCEVERREIIDAARTQYLIERTARDTQEQTMVGLNALGNKVDFYEYQGLRDQLAQERMKNMALENRIYSDAKFGALESQIAAIGCQMLKEPPLYGVSAVCPTPAVINGLGIGGGFGFGGYGGCGGFAGNGLVTG